MDCLDLEEERLRLDSQEMKPYWICDKCDKDIYKGEEYYFYERDHLCEECFDEIQSIEKFEAKRIAGDDDEY